MQQYARYAEAIMLHVLRACIGKLNRRPTLLCIALLVSACATTPTTAPVASTPAAGATRVLIAGVAKENLTSLDPMLDAAWASIKPGGDIVWSPARTPFFASEAPPTSRTIWTSYAFAYGAAINGKLADGQHVAKPWAKIDYHVGSRTFTATLLSGALEDSKQIQGVHSLDADTIALLKRSNAFRDWILGHETWPQWNEELRDLQQYYVSWSANNGVIVSLIEKDHVEFMRWTRVMVN